MYNGSLIDELIASVQTAEQHMSEYQAYFSNQPTQPAQTFSTSLYESWFKRNEAGVA